MELEHREAEHCLGHLRTRYLRDRNPVYVWSAILQIKARRLSAGEPVAYPSWVEAYLFSAAGTIMGIAVAWPEAPHGPMNAKKEKGPRKAVKALVTYNANGSVNRRGLSSGGLSGQDRIDIVVEEALGFHKMPGGSNPLVQAHRDHRDEGILNRLNELRADGHTMKKAIELLGDVSLPANEGAVRKVARMRARLQARNGRPIGET